jgi:hypothetical protein
MGVDIETIFGTASADQSEVAAPGSASGVKRGDMIGQRRITEPSTTSFCYVVADLPAEPERALRGAVAIAVGKFDEPPVIPMVENDAVTI